MNRPWLKWAIPILAIAIPLILVGIYTARWRPVQVVKVQNLKSFQVSPDGRWLTFDGDGSRQLIDLRNGQSTPLSGTGTLVSFSPDGTRAVESNKGSDEDVLRVLSLPDQRLLGRMVYPLNQDYTSWGELKICWLPHQQLAVYTGSTIYTWSGPNYNKCRTQDLLISPKWPLNVEGSAFTLDGRLLRVAYRGRFAARGAAFGTEIWTIDVHTGKLCARARLHPFLNEASIVRFSPDDRMVMLKPELLDPVQVAIYNIETGARLWTAKTLDAFFSPDSKTAVALGADGKHVVIMDAHTGKPIREIGGFRQQLQPSSLRFSRDRKFIFARGLKGGIYKARIE